MFGITLSLQTRSGVVRHFKTVSQARNGSLIICRGDLNCVEILELKNLSEEEFDCKIFTVDVVHSENNSYHVPVLQTGTKHVIDPHKALCFHTILNENRG